MAIRNWWRVRSGRAKTITVLSAFLILQIGLCFGTPTATPWVEALFHIRARNPMEALGLMIWQALFCFVTAVVLVLAASGLLPGIASGENGQKEDCE